MRKAVTHGRLCGIFGRMPSKLSIKMMRCCRHQDPNPFMTSALKRCPSCSSLKVLARACNSQQGVVLRCIQAARCSSYPQHLRQKLSETTRRYSMYRTRCVQDITHPHASRAVYGTSHIEPGTKHEGEGYRCWLGEALWR